MTQAVHSADGAQWSSLSSIRLEKTGESSAEVFNTVTQVPCENQQFSWKARSGGWFNTIVTTKYDRCATSLEDAYFETGSVVLGRIRPYESDKTFGLEFPNQPNANVFAVPGTHMLLVNSWAYQNFSNQPSGLHIIDDYRRTLTDSRIDDAGNKIIRPGKPYDFELRGPDGALISIKQTGLKFSLNGEWMIFKMNYGGSTSWARLNLVSHEVLAFGSPQTLSATYDAISNDGRYVVLYEPTSNLRVYDLERCTGNANKLVLQQCAYIELYSSIKTYLGVSDIQFRDLTFKGDQTISFLAVSKKIGETTWKYGAYTMRYGELPVANGYLAMGDSFSSGEGVYDYRTETNFYVDETLYNLCHQSKSSYPYILNKVIGFERFGSVACSGAKTKDIDFGLVEVGTYQKDDPQAKGLSVESTGDTFIYNSLLPGYREQKNFLVKSAISPILTTISIGGNDIGFGGIVASCVSPLYTLVTCYQGRDQREQLADLIDATIPSLMATYKQLKGEAASPDFRLYVIGYPQIVRPEGECRLNVGMDHYEGEFARGLVDYLNDAIRVAATRAGARYVNVTNAFIEGERDYRLCGNQPNLAVNGLVLRGTTSKKHEKLEYQESYHPNLLGHALLASAINQETQSLTQDVPPEPLGMSDIRQDASLRRAFVGDEQRLIATKKLGYDNNLVQGSVTRGESLQYVSSNSWPAAEPNSRAIIELHSTPIILGEVAFDTQGKIAGSVVVPTSVEPGYHELHIKYNDFFGESVDRYQIIFVRASGDDYDGDGIPNSADPCIVGGQSGVDSDEDGIDDVCDDEYVKSASTQGIDNSVSEEVANVVGNIPLLAAQLRPTRENEGGTIGNGDDKDVTSEAVLSDTADRRTVPPKADAARISADDNLIKLPDWPIMVGALLAISVAFLLVSKILSKRLS